MSGSPTSSPERSKAERLLDGDERWHLVQRVAASQGFSRAKQLRSMLLYVSRWAILHPGEPLREHNIALQVLDRRDDYDPAHDNIVRVQASHLRKRVEDYFATEGKEEPLRLSLPKGSYVPVFEDRPQIEPSLPTPLLESTTTTSSVGQAVATPPNVDHSLRRWLYVMCAILGLMAFALVLWKVSRSKPTQETKSTPPLLMPFLRDPGKVLIVLSDSSLSAIQNLLGTQFTLHEYSSGNALNERIQQLPNDSKKEALEYLSVRKNTSYSESMAAIQLQQEFTSLGRSVEVRFGRDIHVQDFENGNAVLLGSVRSDPWVTLFTEQTNFRFVEDPSIHDYVFLNHAPQPGEPDRYVPQMLPDYRMVGYVDLAVLPNITNTGHVLLIDGSDAEINEAAARFLLHSKLPRPIADALADPDLKSFELLLRGRHIRGEVEENLEIVSFRSQK